MWPIPLFLLITALCFFSAGCASQELVPERASQTPGQYQLNITVDDRERPFILYLPTHYHSKNPLPLVLMLHGGGGTARSAIKQTGWLDKAEQAGFIAVFPEASARNPNRRSSFAFNPQLWNDGSERFYPDQKAVDDVRYLEALLDKLQESYAINKRRIYVTGFSNGASMAFLLAARLPGRIAAVAPVAGACWIDPGKLQPPVPMLYLTGTDDPLNIIAGGPPRLANGKSDAVRAKPKPPVMDSILKWVHALGLNSEPVSTKKENGIYTQIFGEDSSGTNVVYVTVDGLGHTWAGGRRLLPERWVGAATDRIKANDVIWSFFQRHSR